jgi:hypothetical protein
VNEKLKIVFRLRFINTGFQAGASSRNQRQSLFKQLSVS